MLTIHLLSVIICIKQYFGKDRIQLDFIEKLRNYRKLIRLRIAFVFFFFNRRINFFLSINVIYNIPSQKDEELDFHVSVLY